MGLLRFALFGLACILQLQPVYAAVRNLEVQTGDVLVFEGDSLTYGQDESPLGSGRPINLASQRPNATPFPEYLGTLLGGGVKIVNHGFPGDRTINSLQRWKNTNGGDIYFIMYGTNDAGNFAQLPGGPPRQSIYAKPGSHDDTASA